MLVFIGFFVNHGADRGQRPAGLCYRWMERGLLGLQSLMI